MFMPREIAASRVRADVLAALEKQLQDRDWRLNNLYWITNDLGEVIQFHPNEPQADLLANLHNRNIVLKSRQHGFTTVAAILYRSMIGCQY